MVSPWALIPVALLTALAWWPLRTASRRTRWLGTLALSAVLVALPWCARRTSLVALGALALVSVAALPTKLFDSAIAPSVWTRRRFGTWASFLLMPFVVCFRGHLRDPVRPRAESIRLVLRGLLEMLAGAALLRWAFATDWAALPRLVEHVVKLAGLYLLVLDGAFVVATGMLRLAGFAIHHLGRHPVLARTPADFWRRYNCDAGRFLFENVFRRLPLRSAAARMFTVFMANGLLHEYLAWVMCGRVLGYQVAFWALQGLAATCTARWRPTRRRALLAWVATSVFMIASARLFLASVDAVVPWFQPRGVRHGGDEQRSALPCVCVRHERYASTSPRCSSGSAPWNAFIACCGARAELPCAAGSPRTRPAPTGSCGNRGPARAGS